MKVDLEFKGEWFDISVTLHDIELVDAIKFLVELGKKEESKFEYAIIVDVVEHGFNINCRKELVIQDAYYCLMYNIDFSWERVHLEDVINFAINNMDNPYYMITACK